MKKSDEPAYPLKKIGHGGYEEQWPGLTKREYFAGLAMQGLLSENGPFARPKGLAEHALLSADALLAELDKDG